MPCFVSMAQKQSGYKYRPSHQKTNTASNTGQGEENMLRINVVSVNVMNRNPGPLFGLTKAWWNVSIETFDGSALTPPFDVPNKGETAEEIATKVRDAFVEIRVTQGDQVFSFGQDFLRREEKPKESVKLPERVFVDLDGESYKPSGAVFAEVKEPYLAGSSGANIYNDGQEPFVPPPPDFNDGSASFDTGDGVDVSHYEDDALQQRIDASARKAEIKRTVEYARSLLPQGGG